MGNELKTLEPMPLAHAGPINIGHLMESAVDMLSGPGATQAVDALAKLVELQRTLAHDESVKNFHKAFARMQSELPSIPKSKHVSITGGAQFDFAPLERIMPKVQPILKENGLAVYFTEVAALRNPNNTRTRCTLVHVDGHSICSEAEAPPDNKNPMSDMHKSGGANSFSARYALLRVLGIVPMDGDAITESLTSAPINEDQLEFLGQRLAETGADLARFLKYFRVDSLAKLPANRIEEALELLNKKQRASK